MKTKGLNFLEAAQKMKEGKRLKRSGWKNQYIQLQGVFPEFIDDRGEEISFSIMEIEATDWEVVEERNPAHFCVSCNKYLGFRGFCSEECHNKTYDDSVEDEDWNLAEHKTKKENDDGYLIPESYTPSNVKKCRDLILRDINELNEKSGYSILVTEPIKELINKRFGDLK